MNRNIKQIYLHIGLQKTGSTSIQNTLLEPENKISLERERFLYPVFFKEKTHNIPLQSAFCDKPSECWFLRDAGYTVDEIRLFNNRSLFFLESLIKHTQANSIILSGELIPDLNKQNLIQLQQYLTSLVNPKVKIDIIVYVRNPIKFAISEIQEKIKANIPRQSAFLYTKMLVCFLFQDSIEKFIDVFGKENIHLYEFEKVIKHPFGPAGHFLSIIGFDINLVKQFRIKKENQSISQISADLISYINLKEPLLINGKLNSRRYRSDNHCLFHISGKKFDISKTEKQEIYERSLPDALWLREHFNVDYTQKPLIENEKEDIVYNQKMCKEITRAYSKASPVIREIIYQYFFEEVEETKITRPNKSSFLKTLKKIDRYKHKHCFSILNPLRTLRDYYIIKNSVFFDRSYYLHKNDHDEIIKSNPIIHYLKKGAIQGKNPSKDFNTLFYIQQNRDVLDSQINPLTHYILHGKTEGREIQKNFSKFDFLILSDSQYLLKLTYDYLRWHPLIYLSQKHAETILLHDQKYNQDEFLNDLLSVQNGSQNIEQIIAGSLLLIEKNLEITLSKIYDCRPQIKIIFLLSRPENTKVQLEKAFSGFIKKKIFLPIAAYQSMDVSPQLSDKVYNRVFSFLHIEPWKPI